MNDPRTIREERAVVIRELRGRIDQLQRALGEAVAENVEALAAWNEAVEMRNTATRERDDAVALLRRFDTLTRHPYYEPVPNMPGLDANYEATAAFLASIDAKKPCACRGDLVPDGVTELHHSPTRCYHGSVVIDAKGVPSNGFKPCGCDVTYGDAHDTRCPEYRRIDPKAGR